MTVTGTEPAPLAGITFSDQTPPAAEAGNAAEIARIETGALFDQLPQGLTVTLINAAALAVVQSVVIPPETAVAWFVAIASISILRFALYFGYRRSDRGGANVMAWRRAFFAGVLASSVLWGSTAIVLFPSDNFAHQAFIGFVLAGMSAGAVASFITSHAVFLAFIIPACTPYALRMFEQGDPMQIAMGMMCLAFMAAMYMTSKKTSAVTREALRLRFRNDDLVARLGETNDSLRQEVAERKQHQADLERLMIEVKDAAQAKSQFLANMSHEIRTPLNGVIGMSDVLSRSQLTLRQRHQLTLIQKSARTLLGLLNDILDFSRIEAGRIELETAPFDMRELIADSADLIADQAQSKGIELAYVIANDVPTMVVGDQMRLRQVLVNLVSNAVKFTDTGSVVLRVATACEDNEPLIRFAVTDTGIGIEPEFQKHLFDPFKQADPSVTRRFGGTGLGLSISHHLVHLMGGTLACQSTPGAGSEFHFELPLKRAASQASSYAKLRLTGTCRVLAADENAVTREILCNYLKSWKLDVVTTTSGDAVIAQLIAAAKANDPFKIAILSTSLGDISGLELAARISSIPIIKSTRIILATPLNWSDDARASQLANRIATISKPIRQSQLFERIAALTLSADDSDVRLPLNAAVATAHGATFAAHVLLVEDNPVNQEVAIEYLKAFDCTFDVAGNGKEALDALAARSYDLVLMDCQMPVMDGFEATRIFRERQTAANAPRTPMIALTAGAFAGDRDQCLKAGMDGYLSKPFSQQALESELGKWLKSSQPETPEGGADALSDAISGARQEPLDRQQIAAMRDRKASLLQKLIDIYLEHAPVLVAKLREADASHDLPGLKETAHNLKSCSGNMAATGLMELCQLLEVQAMQGEFERARETVEAIEKEYQAVSEALIEEGATLRARTGT
jgi:two-component system sensor histidine kinase/response regulator